MVNKTATICLTIIAVVAIAGSVIAGYHNIVGVAATLGSIAAGCVGGVAGYTIGKTPEYVNPTSPVVTNNSTGTPGTYTPVETPPMPVGS
jgi:hypothetical protein